jgi:hypothetical protein
MLCMQRPRLQFLAAAQHLEQQAQEAACLVVQARPRLARHLLLVRLAAQARLPSAHQVTVATL